MFVIFTYKTAEEKAKEWDVSTRYVQNLCRRGKLEGAIKRGGVWFIPDSAASPSSRKDSHFPFSGTKRKLFEKAAELFAERSFDLVTVKDVADQVGVAQSAFYNHFKSKQELLDEIYEYFRHYYVLDRPSIDELVPILQKGSLMDVISSVFYEFNESYRDILVFTLQIVMQRMFIEVRAKKLYREVVLEWGVEFADQVFQKAVELGRFKPGVDTHALSVLCNMGQHFTLLAWISNSNLLHSDQLHKSQQAIYNFVIQNLGKSDHQRDG